MKWIVLTLMLNPIVGSAFLSFRRGLKESTVSKLLFASGLTQWLLAMSLLIVWLINGAKPTEELLGHVYQHGDFSFDLYYLVDHISITALLTFTTIFLFITRFSRYYLHRDPGYQRYFAILLMFLSGLTILVTAGNIDFLFAGWELLGVSSFLLIGFYHHRLSAIKNSLFVLGIYRLTDIGVILGSWLKKSLIEGGHRFFILKSIHNLESGSLIYSKFGWLISLFLILSALGKSAQFPVSFWLSRAMEGPTSSSAIFYGALSLHAGVFLLLRTFDFWYVSLAARTAAFAVGALTVAASGLYSQSQPNIKSRLAYAASFHVGLQFIELSLGFPNLALAHATLHMIVRCYQFLVSPAVVTYGLRVQNIASLQKTHNRDRVFFSLPGKLQKSIYVFSLNEGFIESLIERKVLLPFKNLSFYLARFRGLFFGGALLFCFLTLVSFFLKLQFVFNSQLCSVGALLMVLLSIASFGDLKNTFQIWNSLALSTFMFGLFPLFAQGGHLEGIPWFLFSIIFFWALGILSLRTLFPASHESPSLESFHAKSMDQPGCSHLLLLCFLGLSGFPLFPAFLGEDIVMESLIGPYSHFAVIGVLVLMLNGISTARFYTRVCWGPTSAV